MAKRTANLHWCDKNTSQVLGMGAVSDGKEVRLRAEWLEGYREPTGFWVQEEAFFLTRMMRRLLGRWHPMPPLSVETNPAGFTFSKDNWQVRPSRVSKQSHFIFKDDQTNVSGRLPVSSATIWTTKSGAVLDSTEVKVPGVGVEASLSGYLGRGTILVGVHATMDPTLVVDVLTSDASGDLDLVAHLQRLLLEQLVPVEERQAQDPWSSVPDFLSRDNLVAAADGFLDPPSDWRPSVSREGDYLVVDAYRPGVIAVDIPSFVFAEPLRTAYALRLTDVDDPENYVITDVVAVDSDGDSVRVRS